MNVLVLWGFASFTETVEGETHALQITSCFALQIFLQSRRWSNFMRGDSTQLHFFVSISSTNGNFKV